VLNKIGADIMVQITTAVYPENFQGASYSPSLPLYHTHIAPVTKPATKVMKMS